jgi:hypothetical protein
MQALGRDDYSVAVRAERLERAENYGIAPTVRPENTSNADRNHSYGSLRVRQTAVHMSNM